MGVRSSRVERSTQVLFSLYFSFRVIALMDEGHSSYQHLHRGSTLEARSYIRQSTSALPIRFRPWELPAHISDAGRWSHPTVTTVVDPGHLNAFTGSGQKILFRVWHSRYGTLKLSLGDSKFVQSDHVSTRCIYLTWELQLVRGDAKHRAVLYGETYRPLI